MGSTVSIVCIVVGAILGTIILPFLGFTSAGVAAGSTAAAWQSSIGAVSSGSVFASLQSLGATTAGTAWSAGVGSAIGGIFSRIFW